MTNITNSVLIPTKKVEDPGSLIQICNVLKGEGPER